MKSSLSFVSCCLLVLALSACSSARESTQAQQGNTFCFTCHSETTVLGQKIKWAEAGWEESVHAKGQVERNYSKLPAVGGCPPFVQATAATCTTNGGTHNASAGNICTMPAGTTPAACAAAGGTFAAAVPDPTSSNACPTFSQFVASGTSSCANVFGAAAYAGTTCTPATPTGATSITQNACQTAGGTFVGPTYVLSGEEHGGSNSFYANGGGCQMCHTMEGYRKRISGQYDTADYSLKYSWDPRAQVGSPTSPSASPPVANTPLTADVILNPSPIGCFACHTPHGIGTADDIHLDQSIPVGTVITTQSGGVWGANKAKGHLCAECHQIRQNNNALLNSNPSPTIAGILANLTGSGKFNVSAPYGPHHGPQADMNLGKGGAEYSGSAGAFTFAGTYGNSPHTTNVNADCVSCHMQSDYDPASFEPTGTFSVSPAVGGHSFTNKGIVHGTEKAFVNGCGSAGCHTVSGVAASSGSRVVAANFAQTNGYLQAGDAYFQKSSDATGATMVDSNYQFKVNELLTKLANPSANCSGLLDAAAVLAGGKNSWTTLNDGVTVDPRCIYAGTTTGVNKTASPGPADNNTNASVRFVKAFFNFKYLLEDKSFGVHNTTYILELLYDSCADLALLTGQSCGSNLGRCSFCEGKFVTTRP